MGKFRAAFFDRDGTLIKDVNYLSNLNQIEFLPGIFTFCEFLQQQGYSLFCITNQSGVARGFFDENFVEKTHFFLQKKFGERDIFFKKFIYCPHHPTEAKRSEFLIDCKCRKPGAGMLHLVANEFDIDLSKSLMFGDKLIDIQAGNLAGCKSYYIQDFLWPMFSKKEFIEKLKGK